MPIDIQRAPATFSQWDALMALLQEAFAYQHARIDPPSSLLKLDADLLAAKAQEEQLFIALDQGELVGCLFARPQGRALYVGKVAVALRLQGQGTGRRLMQAAEQFARGNGFGVLELDTRIELTENHATFAAFGFNRSAENAHAGYDRVTYITMQKPLA